MANANVPLLYIYIFKVMKENCQRVVTGKEIFKCVSRVVYRVPRFVQREILYEFEKFGLIKLIGVRGTNCEVCQVFEDKMDEINKLTKEEQQTMLKIRKSFKKLEELRKEENKCYRIISNYDTEKRINELKDYLFPFSPKI